MNTYNVSDAHIGLNGEQVQATGLTQAMAQVQDSYQSNDPGLKPEDYRTWRVPGGTRLSWGGSLEVMVMRVWPELQVTFNYEDVDYDATLGQDGVVNIYKEEVWAGVGKWDDDHIVDCPADLHEDIYSGLESEIEAKLACPAA